jgi:NTE family protein
MDSFEKPLTEKIGLVLGGGGARGLAHIGVLKVFEREGIKFNVLAGTSMGGLIGALYAAGIPTQEIETEALQRGKTKEIIRLLDLNISLRGLLKGTRIYNQLADTLGPDLTFADLKIPLAVMAVDLRTGREVTISEGKVVEAIRATISVPGIFHPVEIGPYLLVDGGMLNNVPVEAAHNLGATKIIAVDVLPDFRQNQPGQPPVVQPLKPPRTPLPWHGLWHVEMIMISAITSYALKLNPPDITLRPELPADMDVLIGFDRPQVAIAAGEKAAEEALPFINELLQDSTTSIITT